MTTKGNVRRVAQALTYWPAPPPWGWWADDLDHLPPHGPNGEPDFFRHVELLSGTLVFSAPPDTSHERLTRGLADRLRPRLPHEWTVAVRTEVKLRPRTRVRPDIVVAAATRPGPACYEPRDLRLVVEVTSPESAERDRLWKSGLCATAGVSHLWRVEENDGRPVVYVYELDPATRTYAVTGVHHGKLDVPVPFPISVDLDGLPRQAGGGVADDQGARQ